MNLRKMFVVLMVMLSCGLALTATATAAEDESTWDKIKEATSEAVSDAVETAKEKGPGWVESAKEKGSELADKAKEKAPEVAEKAKEGLKDAQEATSDFLQSQEDQFWDWFDDKVNPKRDDTPQEDASDSKSSADETTTPGLPEEELAGRKDENSTYYDSPEAEGGQASTDQGMAKQEPATQPDPAPSENAAQENTTLGDIDEIVTVALKFMLLLILVCVAVAIVVKVTSV